MQWKSPTRPGLSAALLLSFFAASAMLAAHLDDRRQVLAGRAVRDRAAAEQSRLAATALSVELARTAARAPAADGQDLPPGAMPALRLAAVAADIKDAEATHGLHWRSVALGGQDIDANASGSSSARDVASLFRPLAADSRWQALPLRAEADYRSLDEAMDFLDRLQDRGVAVTVFKLDGEHIAFAGQILARGP